MLLTSGDIGYDKWAGIFSAQWMKALTFALIMALIYHVWIGMRDIWMDYIKPVSIRLTLQVLTVLYLLACAAYAAQILWKV